MKIKLITRMAGPEGNFPPESVIEVSREFGRALIMGGYAEAVDAEVLAVEMMDVAIPVIKAKKRR